MKNIKIISKRKTIVVNISTIFYVLMSGKNAEIHVSGGHVYETRMSLQALEEQLTGSSFGSLFSNMDSKWLRCYEQSALYGEVQELMDYSPEIDTYLKVICFPTFKGHCGCFLFDLSKLKFNKSSNDVEKTLAMYLSRIWDVMHQHPIE